MRLTYSVSHLIVAYPGMPWPGASVPTDRGKSRVESRVEKRADQAADDRCGSSRGHVQASFLDPNLAVPFLPSLGERKKEKKVRKERR